MRVRIYHANNTKITNFNMAWPLQNRGSGLLCKTSWKLSVARGSDVTLILTIPSAMADKPLKYIYKAEEKV